MTSNRISIIGRWIVGTTLLVMLGAMTGGCASDQSIISQAAQANTQLQPAIMSDPELANYLQTLGNRIIESAKRADAAGMGPASHTQKGDTSWMFGKNMQFHFVNSKTVNAFTTGGEHMYVYNALFQMCTSEDELAAVMSHEFAHVYCRHVQAGTNRQYEQLGAAGLAAVAGYAAGGQEHGAEYATAAGGGALAAAQFLGMGYTRHDEAQADEWGFYFYSGAGWDPNHFGDFFQAMIDAGYDKTPTELSDHPMLKDRVAAAKARAAEWVEKHDDQFKKPPIADPQKFAALKARAAQIAASTPSDDSLKKAQGLLASFSSCVTPADSQPEQVEARKRLDEAAQKQQQQQQQQPQSNTGQ
jgi:predicted Zn-dependent protease